MKKCTVCNITKPLSEFYKHAEMSDGHHNECKECRKIKVRKNRHDNREHYRLYEIERHKRPERKIKTAEYKKRYQKVSPQVYKARYAVTNAVRDGKLIRKPCIVCGDQKSEAHHHDYSKPLDVMWLCFIHHREIGHGQKPFKTNS